MAIKQRETEQLQREIKRLERLLHIMSVGITTVSEEERRTGDERALIYEDIDHLEQKYPFVKCLDEKGRGRRRETVVSLALIPTPELDFARRITTSINGKKAVARYVVEEKISDFSDTLFLDGGTAALHVAVEIARLVESSMPRVPKNWTIVTNNPLALHILSNRVARLRLVGGDLTGGKNYILNPRCDFRGEKLLKAFIGTSSISHEEGVFCHEFFCDTKIPILDAVEEEIIFLADHTKIGRPIELRFRKVCSFQKLHDEGRKFTVVTDRDRGSQRMLDEMSKFHSDFGPDSFVCV